jgi:hypothetical protein
MRDMTRLQLFLELLVTVESKCTSVPHYGMYLRFDIVGLVNYGTYL